MRLLLDEHFSPQIARQLRTQGRDVVAARERQELHGLSDRNLLALAKAEGRVIATENVADFAALHREALVRGDPHAGLIFTSPKRFPRTRRAIGRMVRALATLMEEHPQADGLAGEVWWL